MIEMRNKRICSGAALRVYVSCAPARPYYFLSARMESTMSADSVRPGRLRDGPCDPANGRRLRAAPAARPRRRRRRRRPPRPRAARRRQRPPRRRQRRPRPRPAAPPAPINLTPTPSRDGEDHRQRHDRRRRPLADRAHDRVGLAHHRQAGRGADTVDQRRRRRMEVRLPRLLPHAVANQLRPTDAGESSDNPGGAGWRAALSARRRPPVAGTQWHSPTRVPGYNYQDWNFTNTVHGPWTQLNFSYGNSRAMATVIVNSYAVQDGGYRTCRRSRASTRRS